MRNLPNLPTIALTLLSTTGVANAADKEYPAVPDLDPISVVHYCPTDPAKEIDFGQVFSNTMAFNEHFKEAITVEPEELDVAIKAKAQEILKSALLELAPDKIKVLADKIAVLTKIKADASTPDDLKAANEILTEVRAKLAVLSTLVTFDGQGGMSVLEVDVTSETLQRADVQAAFGELAERGIICPPPVISYVVAKDSFPLLNAEGNNSPEFDLYVADLKPKPKQEVTAPSAKKTESVPPVVASEQDVLFAKNLMTILSEFSRLEKNAPKAIVEYTKYVSQR